jgi:FtsH-binding integral membrane protein
MIAVGVCALVCIGLAVFAFQTKIDFTIATGLAYVLLLNLLMFGIFAGIFNSNILNIAYSVLGSLLFSFYLVIDVQLIIGGKHKFGISPEE